MNTIMAIAIGCSYNGRHGRRDLNTYINPRYYFRTVGWYLNFYNRMKQEPRHWLERQGGYSESYVRNMRDAGRGRQL